MKKAKLVLTYLVLTFMLAAALFSLAYFEWSKVTIVEAPAHFQMVKRGKQITENSVFPNTVYHFIDPSCECVQDARYQIPQFIRRSTENMNTIIVIPKNYKAKLPEWLSKLSVKVLSDDGSLAQTLGIFATPQVAILNQNRELFYNGSYNQGALCGFNTESILSKALSSKNRSKPFPYYASNPYKAYGCLWNLST